MIGISWGGFNALQVAARKPPALKAIVTLCSTDDRYEDDIHYKGGCLHQRKSRLGRHHARLFLAPARSQDRRQQMAQDVDGAARRTSPSCIIPWLQHPHRDAYWKHGSVCEDFGGNRDARP